MILFKKTENQKRLQQLFEQSNNVIKDVTIVDIEPVLEILSDDLGTPFENLDYRATSEFVFKLSKMNEIAFYSAPEKWFSMEEAVEKAKDEKKQFVVVEVC